MYGNITALYIVTFIFNGKNRFNLFNMTINLEHLIEMFFIWTSKLRFSCKVTPRRLKCWTLSITVSSILRRRLFTCLFPNLYIIYLDFFTFSDNLLIFSHSFILFKSEFKWYSISLVGHVLDNWLVQNKLSIRVPFRENICWECYFGKETKSC